MKTKLLVLIFFAGSIFSNLLFAQFTQQGPKLIGTGSIGNTVDQGSSVAISSDGNTAIVGGLADNANIGAAWIYTRSGGVWTQQGPKLVGAGSAGTSYQGTSVAISSDGNTAIVGGYGDNSNQGAVWIFTRSSGVWTQQGSKLMGSGNVGAAAQGFSVAISADGNTAIEGGIWDNANAGAIWIFTRSGGVWTQQGQKVVGSGGIGNFVYQGFSVGISSDGNTVIESGEGDNGYIGAVWVFTRSGGVWTQQGSKLTGSGNIGQSTQGWSVALSSDGNTFIEGGHEDNGGAGAVWIFTRSGGVWTQQGAKLIGTGAAGNSVYQGASVGISSDGNTFIEGGYFDNNGPGAAWLFTRNGGVWTQLGQKLVGTGGVGNSEQGYSVALSSDGYTAMVGGFRDNAYAGAVWAFVRSGYRFSNSHNNLNLPIQGNQSTSDTIIVGTYDLSSYYVSNVKITIDTINYPIDGDLEISLIHAANTDTLVYQVGGGGANFIGTALSDSASALIANGTPPFTGNFKPSKPLSQFVNFDPSGIWILKIYDRTSGHSGTLKAWTLTLDMTTGPIAVQNISTIVPKEFSLKQNYPNPFNPSTKIKFQIVKSGNAKLIVFDILGREVAALVNQQLLPGTYEVDFDGSKLSSGVYFYILNSGYYQETKKMILIK